MAGESALMPRLQWGPVSRRGGTVAACCADSVVETLQWGPVSRRGGTDGSGARDPRARDRFNGAPSLDGGEPSAGGGCSFGQLLLQWGPVSRRGGTVHREVDELLLVHASMGPRLSKGGNCSSCRRWSRAWA